MGYKNFLYENIYQKIKKKRCDGSSEKNISVVFKRQWTSLLATGSFIPSVGAYKLYLIEGEVPETEGD